MPIIPIILLVIKTGLTHKFSTISQSLSVLSDKRRITKSKLEVGSRGRWLFLLCDYRNTLFRHISRLEAPLCNDICDPKFLGYPYVLQNSTKVFMSVCKCVASDLLVGLMT